MKAKLEQLLIETQEGASSVMSLPEFDQFKARVVGPNGKLTEAIKGIGQLTKEERPLAGKLINEAKVKVDAVLESTRKRIEAEELSKKIGVLGDPTLPSKGMRIGNRHPLSLVIDRVYEIFRRVGFTFVDGSEVESEWYCFDALNTAPDHPARDEQDTLFLPEGTLVGNVNKKGGERYILRTQTSAVQIRTMLKEKPPMRVLSVGRCFRRDTVDATHSANFHQVEGFCVDRDVSVVDLKGVLDYFIRELLGNGVETRFRSSFFPFTEPSFEMDIKMANFGKLSGRWIEILGCGLVDPNVFNSVGYSSEEWGGYAFGVGIERIAMLLYGIDDIRHFYQNDIRFLKQFN